MKYIYDILLNWTDDNIYEFFEWQNGDELEHIKKIPIMRINSKDFNNIYNSIIEIDNNLLEQLKDRTELYINKRDNQINYAVIFTDGLRALAIEFNSKGKSICKSSLLLDEENEVIDITNKLEEIKINYKIINQNKDLSFLTRYERKIKRYLINEFNKIYKEKNINKLKYLYYEWFNNTGNDFNLMFNQLKQILDIEWNEQHINLYNLIKLSYIKK